MSKKASRDMSSSEDVRFDHNKSCPTCKADGNETGFEVKRDCPDCLGTGYARKEK